MPGTDGEPTVGELKRRLEQVEAAEKERRYVTLERYDADRETTRVLFSQLTENVTALKDTNKWIARALGGAFVGLLVEGIIVIAGGQ